MSSTKGLKRWLSWLQPQYERCIVCDDLVMTAPSSTDGRPQHIRFSKLITQHKLCVRCVGDIAWIDTIMCKHCGRRERCPDCSRNQTLPLWLNRSAVSYNDCMKQWLHQFKFQGDERLAAIMGSMLLPAVEQATFQLIVRYGLEQQYRRRRGRQTPLTWLKSINGGGRYWDVITAVPLSDERLRERGFNQAELLAKVISEQTAIPYYELLLRPQHSDRLSHKSRHARLANTANRYACSGREWNRLIRSCINGNEGAGTIDREADASSSRLLHILLIDDVYTTGTTVRACASTMIENSPIPVKVASVTWARS